MPFLMSTHRSGGTLGGTPEAFAFTGMDIKKAPHTQGKVALVTPHLGRLGNRKGQGTKAPANIRAVQEGLREGLRGRKHLDGLAKNRPIHIGAKQFAGDAGKGFDVGAVLRRNAIEFPLIDRRAGDRLAPSFGEASGQFGFAAGVVNRPLKGGLRGRRL